MKSISTHDEKMKVIESNVFSNFIFKCNNDTICQNLYLNINEPIYIVSNCHHLSCQFCYNKIKSKIEIEDVFCRDCKVHSNYKEISLEKVNKTQLIKIITDYDNCSQQSGIAKCQKHPNVAKFLIELNNNEEYNSKGDEDYSFKLPSQSNFICESCHRELQDRDKYKYISIEKKVAEFKTEIEESLKKITTESIKNKKKKDMLTSLIYCINISYQKQKETIINVMQDVQIQICNKLEIRKNDFETDKNKQIGILDEKVLSLAEESNKLKEMLGNVERKICGLSANANYSKIKAQEFFNQEEAIQGIVDECSKSNQNIQLEKKDVYEPRLRIQEEIIREQLSQLIQVQQKQEWITDVIKHLNN